MSLSVAGAEKTPTLKEYLNAYTKLKYKKSMQGQQLQTNAKDAGHGIEDLEEQIRSQLGKIRELIQQVNNNIIQKQLYNCVYQLSLVIDQLVMRVKKSERKSQQNIAPKSPSVIKCLTNTLHTQLSVKSLDHRSSVKLKRYNEHNKNIQIKKSKQIQPQSLKQQVINNQQIQQYKSNQEALKATAHFIKCRNNRNQVQNLCQNYRQYFNKDRVVTTQFQSQSKKSNKSRYPTLQIKTKNLDSRQSRTLENKKSQNNINSIKRMNLNPQTEPENQKQIRNQRLVYNEYQIRIGKCTSNYP